MDILTLSNSIIPTSKSLVSWFTTGSDAGAGGVWVETLACTPNAEKGEDTGVSVSCIVLTGVLHIVTTSSYKFLPNANEFVPKTELP